MPPRGTAEPLAGSHPDRLREIGLCAVGAGRAVVRRCALFPRNCGQRSRALLLGFGTRLQFVFFAVLMPVLTGEVIKWAVGRGRPFVGGEANAFNFEHFNGTEAYASFPSGHAITSFCAGFRCFSGVAAGTGRR